jgi:hypothetical protein
MTELKQLNEDDITRMYRIPDGRIIIVEITDDPWILIKNENKQVIGRIEFVYYEGEFPWQEFYHLTWMYLDLIDNTYLHQGIGRECLKYFKSVYKTKITASENNGIERMDGSHLTGDAPGFVSSMVQEGIIDREI